MTPRCTVPRCDQPATCAANVAGHWRLTCEDHHYALDLLQGKQPAGGGQR